MDQVFKVIFNNIRSNMVGLVWFHKCGLGAEALSEIV